MPGSLLAPSLDTRASLGLPPHTTGAAGPGSEQGLRTPGSRTMLSLGPTALSVPPTAIRLSQKQLGKGPASLSDPNPSLNPNSKAGPGCSAQNLASLQSL